MSLEKKFQVAISNDFFTAFAALPKNQQKKTADFINKFKSNPTGSGINYEPIIQAKDSNMKSVRIDQAYRGIIHKPDKGNVYLLLWVDHHDEAYDWAKNKKCEINSSTGTIQIFEVDAELVNNSNNIEEDIETIFGDISQSKLKKIGISEELIHIVKKIKSEDELEKKRNLIPLESYEALQFILGGISIDDVINELFAHDITNKEVDTSNYEEALKTAGSKQQFIVINDETEKELNDMLAAPLDKWRVFLHKSQRKIVEKNYSGSARVLGGAGTGKTVVAMHRAKWLATKVFNNSNDKILFTTFTVNLAEDIKNNLKKICNLETLKRIEVINIDKWAESFLKSQDYNYKLEYDEIDNMWNKAIENVEESLNFDKEFFKEEWEKIITTYDVKTLNDYLKTSRLGRGTSLNRKERKLIWEVFEEYKAIMRDTGKKDIYSIMIDARAILKKNPNATNYKAIIVDEGQDLSAQAYKLIRDIVSEEKANNIFVVGDSHQRIYRQKASHGKCGIKIRGRSKILKINYRTTEETRNWAFSVLKGIDFDDLDEGLENGKGYKSLMNGPKPKIENYKDFEEEIENIVKYINDLQNNGINLKSICLVLRTNKLINQYKEKLRENGIDVYQIKTEQSEDRSINCIRIATLHRVKGLEFDYVIISSVNSGTIPLSFTYKNIEDEVVKKEMEISERSLLYVAATRAKKELLVTSYGKKSEFL